MKKEKEIKSETEVAIGLAISMLIPFLTISIGASLWSISSEWSRTIGLNLSITLILYGLLIFIKGALKS